MKLVPLFLLGCTLFGCTKEVSQLPVSQTLAPQHIVASAGTPLSDSVVGNHGVRQPDSSAATPDRSVTDSDGGRWRLSLLDSAIAKPVPDSIQGPHMEWSDSLDAFEIASIAGSGGKVSRDHGELLIRLLNGRTLTMKTDSTMRYVVRYAGYLKGIHSHVVHRVPYEDAGDYVLLDDSTGDSTIVWAMPLPSPDGTRFVMTTLDTDADSTAGSIAVWRMVGRVPEKEFSVGEPWESSNAVWRDSRTIDFVKDVWDPDHPFKYVKSLARLSRIETMPGHPDSTNK
jgi:hypothetical protein